MERKIASSLSSWKERKNHMPILITGCRQVGKTYSMTEFAKSAYADVVYINFDTDIKYKELFDGPLDFRTIINRIETSFGIVLRPGKSAIILDEIQLCPNAYSSLKNLAQQNDVDILASGSFLGLYLENPGEHLSPMGYVEIIRMHPMDFEEFLWALGVDKGLINSVRDCVCSVKIIDGYINKELSDIFRKYMVIGGMPAAVFEFSKTGSIMKARNQTKKIIDLLRMDAGNYSRKTDRMKINSCFDSIPEQLAGESKIFAYSRIEKKYGKGQREYGEAVNWLANAGIIHMCKNLEEPVPPLSMKTKPSGFKIYLCDTGILAAMMDSADTESVIFRDPYSNNGMFAENAVAQCLASNGYPLRYYKKSNSTLEIDFVINFNGKIGIIEVKSGKSSRSKSLNTLMFEKDRSRIGFKLKEGNVMTDDNGVVHLPLYGAAFFDPPAVRESEATDIGKLNGRYAEIRKSADGKSPTENRADTL